MRIVIIGANEQMGQEFQKLEDSHHFLFLTHDDIEVTDRERTRSVLAEHQPEAVLNTSAFHRKDDCEEDAAKLSRFLARHARLGSERSWRTSQQPDDDRPRSTRSKSNTFVRASSHRPAARL